MLFYLLVVIYKWPMSALLVQNGDIIGNKIATMTINYMNFGNRYDICVIFNTDYQCTGWDEDFDSGSMKISRYIY